MRLLVLLLALAMPAIAFLNQRQAFGPDNGQISDQYPTLLVAAGYAFAIWSVIFLWDIVFGAWQLRAGHRDDATLARVRPWAAAGFALTAAWMPIFSMQLFWLALLVIWAALACTAVAAIALKNDPDPLPRQWWFAGVPLSLHAGWLSLAAFLNTAQTIVAYRWLPTGDMLGWSLVLLAGAAVLLMALNARMRGNIPYAAAAIWGLVAAWIKQKDSALPGADTAAVVALLIAVALLAQTEWLRRRARHAAVPARAGT